jgi:peptidoglycan/LPS O-acetylase OafA/YrhL
LTTLIVYRKETELYSIAYMKLIYIGLTIFADVALCMFMINITAIFNRITPYIIQNPVSLFISRYSLEIYALQGMIIIVVFKYSPNIYAASAVSFIVTILLAIPLHYLLQFILKPIKCMNKKKETK